MHYQVRIDAKALIQKFHAAGYSYNVLADRIGISNGHVHLLLLRDTLPNRSTAERILARLTGWTGAKERQGTSRKK